MNAFVYFQVVLYEYVCLIAVNCSQIKFFELSIVDMRSEGSNAFVYSLVVSFWTIDWVKVCLNVLLPPTCWCKMRQIERLVVLPSSLTMNIVVEAKLYCFQGHIKPRKISRTHNFFFNVFLRCPWWWLPKIFSFKWEFYFLGGVSHQNLVFTHLINMQNTFEFSAYFKGEFVLKCSKLSKWCKNFFIFLLWKIFKFLSHIKWSLVF